MSNDHLVQMANDIAANMAAEGDRTQVIGAIATHLRRYWEPRMRARIIAHLASGGDGLAPLARAAVEHLRGL
ncbi:MAG: formate dehydrogenase subunit delta [Tahibacter sp.]